MKRTLKIASAAIYMALGVASTNAVANIPPPPFEDSCVQDGMRNYCRATGQGNSCPVPTHIYYRIVSQCV